MMAETSDTAPGDDSPAFTCISYAWGSGRVPHPFDARQTMSDRTLAVIETAVRIRCPGALWIDAFSVPFDPPARSTCLGRMGEIYSHASEVVVVLSERCSSMLTEIRESSPVSVPSLLQLEGDGWVSRVWTYQELVNNNKIFFVTEGSNDCWAQADDVLRNVAYAIDDYRKARGYNAFEFRSLHPKLDALESLILDWKIGPYLQRSAYQVISAMDQRDAVRPEDYFYAMMGAIGSSPAEDTSPGSAHPADRFMRICEQKGDYSFIYSTGPRSTAPGRGWRPEPGDQLKTVLPWPSCGDGQRGKVHPTHIQLDGLWRVTPGPICATAKKFVADWLQRIDPRKSAEDTPARILALLQLAGFSGCGNCLEMEQGYLFPQLPVTQAAGVFAAVATGVQMPFGSPALLLRRNGPNNDVCCGTGMFVGSVPKSGESRNVV